LLTPCTPPSSTRLTYVRIGTDNDFYASTAEDESATHSDSEMQASSSSHSHGRPAMNHTLSPEAAFQSPPITRPFLPQNGHSLSSQSRANSYRFTYMTNHSSPRAFPPSAFIDPAAGVTLGPNGQPIYPEHSSPPSTTSHASFYQTQTMSVDETGHYHTFSPGNRTSSMTSFAPPPAPWMRSELDSSRVSMASTGGRGTMTPKRRPPHPSALLKGPIEKPWLNRKDPWATVSWWITAGLFFLGVAGSAVLVFFGVFNTPKLGKICQVMHEDFNSLDTALWHFESELGGFGNGEFEMTTQNPKNAYTDGGKLYIVPTLTEDDIGNQVYDAGTYTLDNCTSNNQTACTVASSEARKAVINPVQSARINTKGVATIGLVSHSAQ